VLYSSSRGVSFVGLPNLGNEAEGEVKVALVKQCVGVFSILKEVMEGSRDQCQIQQGQWS
jgi:hypothetical protein